MTRLPALRLFAAASIIVVSMVVLSSLAGCTTYKVWNYADSDEQTRTIAMYYEYRKFESPQADERQGVQLARERCKDWGFPSAQRKGEDRQCVEGEAASCSKWRVIREYRCVESVK